MSKRVDEAEKRFRRDADRGDPVAQLRLGHAYYLDAKEAGDYSEALILIRKSAAQDYATALSHLGRMYLVGSGVPIDLEESKSWFCRAAQQGDAMVQSNYATMLWNGDFGSRDSDEAEIWWLKAAEQGYVVAHMNLGEMFADPWQRQPPRDVIQGYMWYTLAALRDEPGHDPGTARSVRDRIAEAMIEAHITEAEARVAAWLISHREVMGDDLVTHWRERVAEPSKPLSLEELAEAWAESQAQLARIEKKFGRFNKDE